MISLVNRARQRVSRIVRKWDVEAPARRFMAFCRRKWPQRRMAGRDSVVLLGLFASKPSIICYAYVANHLAEMHGARIESYQFLGRVNPLLRKLYESFGARFSLDIEGAASAESEIQARVDEILSGLKTKWDVMKLTVDGLLIGDQVYDSYLRFYNESTLQIDDPRFRQVLVHALQILHATRDYLARTRVAAFITDDFSYINAGIITRLMFRAGVPMYVVNVCDPFSISQVDAEPSGTGEYYPPPIVNPYYAFPKLFDRLSAEEKEAAILKARHALEARLSGVFCPLVQMPSTTYAASNERALHEGPEPRILVMLHDFVDSPHGFRNMLFPDFFEWIVFVLERAEKTNFRWYVKPHPSGLDPGRSTMNEANDKVVEELKRRFPKITFLPPATSNQQILNDGVTAMFSVHGTAGHEYAYRDVPVVFCGDNPHIAYDFCLNAKTLEEYEQYIFTADRLRVSIDKRAIEEFFYMYYFYYSDKRSSSANPIDERVFAAPDWESRINRPEIYDEFLAGVTRERERSVGEYLRQVLGEAPQSATSQKL